jgi:phage gp36-like protein
VPTAFITRSSLLERFTEPTINDIARSENCGIDDDRVTKAIDFANSLIDSYVLGICPGGLAESSQALVEHAHATALYALAKGRDDVLTDAIRQGYDDALAWLKLVANRTIKLKCNGTTVSGPSFAVRSPEWTRPTEGGCRCRC